MKSYDDFITRDGSIGLVVSARRYRSIWLCELIGCGPSDGAERASLPMHASMWAGTRNSDIVIEPWDEPICTVLGDNGEMETWHGPVGPDTSIAETIRRAAQNRIWIKIESIAPVESPAYVTRQGSDLPRQHRLILEIAAGSVADTADFVAYREIAMQFGKRMSHGDRNYLAAFEAEQEATTSMARGVPLQAGDYYPVTFNTRLKVCSGVVRIDVIHDRGAAEVTLFSMADSIVKDLVLKRTATWAYDTEVNTVDRILGVIKHVGH